MEIIALQIVIGYIIDLMMGDPPRIPHPVVFIGRGIACLERAARKWFNKPAGVKVAGVGIALIITAGSYATTALILWAAWQVHYYLFLMAGTWLISTTIATRGLADAALEIRRVLASGDLALARQRVGWIVGRDTGTMSGNDVVRATVETVAENLNDAVVAPLFYACIGGPALAMAYRAVNTLDSMMGYKNEKYLHLGWASARLDDIAGYIPARLTGLLLLMVAWLSNRDWRRALAVWRRDAALHSSPNSGIPESVMAGALGIRLGGRNVYGGVVTFRAYMGDQVEQFRPDHITRSVDMLYEAAAAAVISFTALLLIVQTFYPGFSR